MDYSKVAKKDVVEHVIAELAERNIDAVYVPDRVAAKEKVLSLIPSGAEVFTMSSITLKETGIADAINNSSDYVSVRNKLNAMNRETQSREMQVLGAAPQVAVGSVHAVTEDGDIYIASNTGSQLPAYAYGADRVIWVVGTQKIVLDGKAALDRLDTYILPKESVRLSEQYHAQLTSNVSKLLIVHKEFTPGRVTVVFVGEQLGF